MKSKKPAVMTHVVIGVSLASAVAALVHRRGLLTRDGAVAASLVGSAVYVGTGVRGSCAMLGFFATSSLLGSLPSAASATQRRGNVRDAVQVLANGGIPAVLALAAVRAPAALRPRILAAYGGAVAAATADTWATEIGTRFGQNPRSIVNCQPLSPGASGAVSLAGVLGAIAGAALIAALVAPPTSCRTSRQAIAIALGGVFGSLVDSWCGAAWQEMRYCPACQITTELLIHSCGNRTLHLRGLPWCNNDVVNLIAVASGALVAFTLDAIGARDTSARARMPRV